MYLIDKRIKKMSTEEVAREILGHYLYRMTDRGEIIGIIVETEAYLSVDDSASHSYRGLNRKNASMFGPAGTAYVYLVYGRYYCLNLVTRHEGVGEAVLIRAVEPVSGYKLIRSNRGKELKRTDMANGPGKVTMAFDINQVFDGHDFSKLPLMIIRNDMKVNFSINTTPRIGVTKNRDKLLRYYIKGSKYVSRRE